MKFLKGAAIFLAGAGVGASISYVYFQKMFNEKKAELEEIKEHYNAKIENEINKKISEDIVREEGYISYSTLGKEDLADMVKRIEDKALETAAPTEDYPSEPIIITEADFSERELYFEKLDLDYYMVDGALVDEADELTEIEDTIGYDNLEAFLNDNNEDVMYVRNAEKSTDYQVRKMSGSYSETIGLGGDADDE